MSVLRGSDTLKQAYPKINSKFDALDAKDRELQSNIDTSNRNNAAEIERIDNRIDNIVSQAGDDNTEIVDARLGADGKARPTLGTLVREIHEEVVEPKYTDPIVIEGGIGSIPDNVVEGQISGVELKGRTYTQLFEIDQNDWRNSLTKLVKDSENSTINQNSIYFNGNAAYNDRINIPVANLQKNKKYGMLFYVDSYLDSYKYLQIWNLVYNSEIDSNYISISINGEPGYRKAIIDTTNLLDNYQFNILIRDAEVSVYDLRLIELNTQEAIEEFDNLSAEELAQKYPYINGTKSTFSAMRLKSVGKNLFQNSFLPGYWDTTGNFVADTKYMCNAIKLEPGTYTISFAESDMMIIIRHENGSIIKSASESPVTFDVIETEIVRFSFRHVNTIEWPFGRLPHDSQIQLEKGSVVTQYEPYTESIAYIPNVGELRSLPNGTKDEINVTDRKLIKRIGEKSNIANGMVIDFTDMAEGGTYYAWNDDGETETGVKGDTLGINATTLIYQLAQEKIIELQPQSLTIYPNGTVYWEPIVKETAVYNNGISIDNGIPIKAIEKLYMTDGQTKTEIPIQNINIAPDRLSFTIVGATDGETYEYIYEYDSSLTTIPTMEIIANKNLKAIVRSTDKALTTLNSAVLDLNDFTVAMLLNHEMRLTLLEV